MPSNIYIFIIFNIPAYRKAHVCSGAHCIHQMPTVSSIMTLTLSTEQVLTKTELAAYLI